MLVLRLSSNERDRTRPQQSWVRAGFGPGLWGTLDATLVAAELAPHFEPRAVLAKQGPLLRRIDERPRAHAVDVLVCGLERCARSGSSQRVTALPLVVELAPGESWGGALELAYDYWWARVRYDRREACPPNERLGG